MVQKVLQISLRSDLGGGPKHLLDLSESLSESSWEVFIAAPTDKPFYSSFKRVARNYFCLPHRKFSVFKLLQLIIFCRENGISTIHSHGRGAGIYSRIMYLFGFKVVHTFHGVHSEGKSIQIFLERLLAPFTSSFISVSDNEYLAVLSQRIGLSSKSHVVYNGVYVDECSLRPKKYNEVVLGTLARLSPVKGLDKLIMFLGLYKKENPEQKFIFKIAGDGEQLESLRSLSIQQNLEDEIQFLGEISNTTEFLRGIDWYISSSVSEGMPLSVLEAMGSKIPCILSRVRGNLDLGKGGCSLLYERESYESFFTNFSKIFSRDHDSLGMVEKAYNKIVSHHSIRGMREQIEKIYLS